MLTPARLNAARRDPYFSTEAKSASQEETQLLTTPQGRSIAVEGTPLAHVGSMPTATPNHTTPIAHGEKTASAALPTEHARQPLAEQRERAAEARESLDNPYDNLACTD
jgi:hypothetical protein